MPELCGKVSVGEEEVHNNFSPFADFIKTDTLQSAFHYTPCFQNCLCVL